MSVVRFDDGVLVEVAITDEARQVSSADVTPLDRSFSQAASALDKLLIPLITSGRKALDQTGVSEVEMEIGCTFTAELGIPVITKSSLGANLKIKIKLANAPIPPALPAATARRS
jgi:hypothetical protein